MMSYPTLEEEIEVLRAHVAELEEELSSAKRSLQDRERELEMQQRSEHLRKPVNT